MSRLGTGLSRTDWLDEGQRLLRGRGIEGVSIRALTDGLGVSKGSFYHHFKDLDDYLATLADYFSNEQMIDFFERALAANTADAKNVELFFINTTPLDGVRGSGAP